MPDPEEDPIGITNKVISKLYVSNNIKSFLNKYWIVLLLGAFFILTCIYNCFGVNKDVFWNTYIKTVRELLVIILLWKHKNILSNTLSMIFCYGGIAMSLGYMIFRFYTAILSKGDYDVYFEFMRNTQLKTSMSLFVLVILLSIKILNKK